MRIEKGQYIITYNYNCRWDKFDLQIRQFFIVSIEYLRQKLEWALKKQIYK